MTVETFASLAEIVRARPARLGPVRLVAVDGPAGSGKTTFAERLAGELGAPVVHLDDLLEGWTDLRSMWPRLEKWVLAPLRRGDDAAYRTYDWHAGEFRTQWTAVPVPDVLILEGVGAARAEMAPDLTLAVFLTADRELRLARGIERDGEALRAEWLRWLAAEDVHFAGDRTVDRADLLVDGAPAVPHDPAREFVVKGG